MIAIAEALLQLPRAGKRLFALSVDLVLCLATVATAYALRLDQFALPAENQWLSYLAAPLIALPLFVTFGLYRAIFRYESRGASAAIVKACFVYAIIYFSIFTLIGIVSIPRTIGIIQPILLFLSIASSRTTVSFLLGGRYRQVLRRDPRRAIIYGAGSAGRQLAAALTSANEMRVVAFIDDDPRVYLATLDGIPIYPLSRLEQLVERLRVSDVLLAIPSASRQRRNQIISRIQPLPVVMRMLPAVGDLVSGKVTVKDLHELDIEDLLGRDAVSPDQDLLSQSIVGKTVLVTGAGGSIGSELCRQLLAARPRQLLLVDMNEFNLYAIERELAAPAAAHGVDLIALLASVNDEKRMARIFTTYGPQTIYHAAAYKHVPIVERNQLEGIRNNVGGTRLVADLARRYGAEEFVLISTDKAVRPTSIMGTTKRLAEQILQAMAAEGGSTRFCMVRFGNVLGSSGSVVPLFRQQIASGGPITLTDERITRYFMTIPEAAQLVLQAGAMSIGGEVFVLDMGEPIKIIDLARNMIELSGLKVREPGSDIGDIAIEVVGLREGEKLYEELLIGENPMPTPHPRILKAHDAFIPWPDLQIILERLDMALHTGDAVAARQCLLDAVPEYEGRGRAADLLELEASST